MENRVNFTKAMRFIVGACCCGLLLLSTAPAGAEIIDLRFRGETLSGRIADAPLGEVLRRFEQEKGIRVRCDPAMAGEKVDARFGGLSKERALRRILKNADHGLVFDAGGRVIEVVVKGKGEPGVSMAGNADPAFRIIRNALPPDGQAEPEPVADPAFKVIRNSDPPGGPFTPRKGVQP